MTTRLSAQASALVDEITATADRGTFEQQLAAFNEAAVSKHRALHRSGAAGKAEADRRFGKPTD